jgi:hypothetical protein
MICDFFYMYQLTIGVATPVSVPNRTLSISDGLQMLYLMPTDPSIWYTKAEIGKREISNGAIYEVYMPLESFLEDHGFDGRACLLRSICEAAHSPFYHEDMHLIEEIVHAVLT